MIKAMLMLMLVVVGRHTKTVALRSARRHPQPAERIDDGDLREAVRGQEEALFPLPRASYLYLLLFISAPSLKR
jgi:hypothetical protein